eukprot:1655780-Rhodomonas_salina.2
MVFTSKGHQNIAWANLLFLGVFVVVIYNAPVRPATVVSSQLESLATLTVKEKFAMLKNSSRTNGTAVPEIPLSLHFTNTLVDLGPVLIFTWLLISLYSLLSAAWVHRENESASLSVQFDLSTIGGDSTSVLMDILFWAVFAAFHSYAYLSLVRFCLQASLFSYVSLVFGLTWVFCNRVVYRYVPAIFAGTLGLCAVHMKAVGDIMERDADQWLPYFVLIVIDGMLLIGHTFDEMLNIEVALNCRIVYVCSVGVFISLLLLFA